MKGYHKKIRTIMIVISLIILTTAWVGSPAFTSGPSGHTSQKSLQMVQSRHLANAAKEYAKYRIQRGMDLNVTNKPFAEGTFSIRSHDSGTIIVSGQVGNFKTVEKITL